MKASRDVGTQGAGEAKLLILPRANVELAKTFRSVVTRVAEPPEGSHRSNSVVGGWGLKSAQYNIRKIFAHNQSTPSHKQSSEVVPNAASGESGELRERRPAGEPGRRGGWNPSKGTKWPRCGGAALGTEADGPDGLDGPDGSQGRSRTREGPDQRVRFLILTIDKRSC
jgi:hypothetical protein